MRTIAVGQAGGPTPVINDTLAGILTAAKQLEFKVIGLRNGFEGGGLNTTVPGNLVDLTNLNETEINSIRGIPGAYLGSTRLKLKAGQDQEKISKIRANMDSLGVESVFYIGGNDSADVILSEGRGVHVAKTIDNDLVDNDHCPGWASACLANSVILRALESDMSGFNPKVKHNGRKVYSTAPVVVYQTQGRDTGWLAIGSAFAKMRVDNSFDSNVAPHLFLPREIPYDREDILNAVDRQLTKRGYVFIVCGEELVDSSGVPLAKTYTEERVDEHGHAEHGRSGAFNYAEFIARVIKDNLKTGTNYLKIKETPISPQHIQRCLMRSQFDAYEAFELGRRAVFEFSEQGEVGFSMGLKNIDGRVIPSRIPLENVAGKVRRVEDKYIGDINGPTPLFLAQFYPLLDRDLKEYDRKGPVFKNYE